jgi:translation initiation factor 5
MQAKMLNIPTYIDDPSYRYKMPALQLKVEGRGNGIKTKIVNLNEVATALRVPPAYPLKFLGHELGSQTNESQAVINGSFLEPEMRKHLDKFIEKYVLCTQCKYPEMVVRVKHGAVGGVCNSCGTRSVLDNQHKLAAYILKNPPKNNSEFKGDKKDEKKEDKKDDKKDDKKEDKKHKHEKDHHHDKKEEKKHADEEKGEKHVEKVEKIKEVIPQIVAITFKDLEEDLIQKVKGIYQQHSSVKNFSENPEAVEKIIAETFKTVPEEYAIKVPYILFNAIFDVNIAKEVGKNKAILEAAYTKLGNFGTNEQELDTLLSLERFLLIRNLSQDFEKFIPTILKFFYDEDLVSEEFLIDWDKGRFNPLLIMDFRYQKAVDEKFKNCSKPIIRWLKDEGGDDEGEGDGEGADSDIDIDNI